MIIFAVFGTWIPTDNDLPNRPKVNADYDLLTCDDVTGNYPPVLPNIGVWQCRTELEATVDAIDANPDYAVLWSEYEAEV